MVDGFDTARLERNKPDDKPRRRYDSSLRRAQAAQTWETVLEAGRDLFLSRGYGRTTMRDIAAGAGVAVDSVYGHFKSKSAVLTALMDRAHGGDSPDAAVADRPWVREIHDRSEAGEQLDTLADNLSEVYRTLAPLSLAVRRAADADATAARIWAERNAERLDGLARYAERAVAGRAFSAELTADDARDVLYAVTSPELYGLFVLDRGWSTERYARWLARTLRDQLL